MRLQMKTEGQFSGVGFGGCGVKTCFDASVPSPPSVWITPIGKLEWVHYKHAMIMIQNLNFQTDKSINFWIIVCGSQIK